MTDATVLSIVEALRGYITARADRGLAADELARRWLAEQLLPPEPADFDQAMRLMAKTRRGHERVPRRG
ncbi:MAG: hypothetical protein AAF610_01095 [Pseudomonadota bacterium]